MKKSLLLLLFSLCSALGVCAQAPLPVASYMNAEGKLKYLDFKASDAHAVMGDPQIVTIRKEVVVDYQCVPNPGNPPTGNIRVYCDSGTGKLTCLNSAGASCISSGGGTVTSVSGTPPIVSSGGTTPAISCATCTTAASSLTNNQLVFGAGAQAEQIGNLSGDVTTSGTGATTLATVATPGSCGDATHTCATTIDAKGRVTNQVSTAITATTVTIASGTATLNTNAISSGSCDTVVTVAATGVATTDTIHADFNADPTSTVGYQPLAMLTIVKYPTSNNVNFKVCNNTPSLITPGSAIVLNWRVTR